MFFFFNDTATTEIYTLSLHDALPIWRPAAGVQPRVRAESRTEKPHRGGASRADSRTTPCQLRVAVRQDRKSTRLNSSHANISYAGFCLQKKKNIKDRTRTIRNSKYIK